MSGQSNKEIDFTRMRKGTRVRGASKIEICPKCGRKGERTNYSRGGGSVTHKAISRGWCLEVTESCYLTTAEVANGC